ncbi:MAG: hypothetical protein GAK28_03910 [Luteibacter sp.]|nr:MAG: hypothetical protein GAK28_03910 [Luteibacter sp.]
MNIAIQSDPLPDICQLVRAMGSSLEDFDWHVGNMEAVPWPVDNREGWLSGRELSERLLVEPVQIFWGVLDAFPVGMRTDVEILPWADGNLSVWEPGAKPQIDGARFEIVFWDSGEVLLIGLSEAERVRVKDAFPEARFVGHSTG